MIDIQISEKKFWENKAEGYIFLIKEDLTPLCDANDFNKVEKDFYPKIKQIFKKHKFSGKKGEYFALTASFEDKLLQFIFIGLGNLTDRWNIELENLRRAIGTAVVLLKKFEIEKSVLALPSEKPFGLTKASMVKQIIIAAIMATYEFEKFKSDKKTDWSGQLILSITGKVDQTFAISLHEGNILGKATNFARYLADLPANYLTPVSLGEEAKKIADEYNMNCTVFGRKRAVELNMGGFLAVDSGSDQEGQFVILEYSTEKAGAPTIALVGKGVTFDSGGISLKPSVNMEGMKFDMSGAAAVIAAMSVIAQLKPEINVVGITPLVENMPSGKACRQDDIITFMNGKTAEIKSTDAEGRLILADALCYAEKFYKPEVIVDVATLTGACVYALGHFFAALMTKDEVLGTKLQAVSLVTGDRVWALPLDDDYKPAIRSEVADIANSGSSAYLAGTITAGWFLSNFVSNSKWAHIDIAGTSHDVPPIISYLGKGATGFGVRLLSEFVMNYAKTQK